MADNVNINVEETNEIINIVASEVQEVIDINVFETAENVTLNITEDIIEVNINKVTAAEQIQSDWNQTDVDALDFIKNKPTIPSAVTNTSDLINDGADGVNPFITLEDIPPVTGFVPYTGATQNVDLGEYEIKAGQVEFDQTPTGAAGVGVMRWNDTDGTLDLGLKGGNVTLQLGQEQVARVVNKTATNITLLESNYQVVKIIGATGQRLSVDLAQANNDLNSATTLGVVTETIANNQEGFITTGGQVKEINTTGSLQGETWADGDVLYLSPTTAGKITNIKPTAPNHTIIVGYVEYAHAIHGKIFVKVDNGYELEELHNVTSTNYTTPIDTDSVLTYDVTNSLWKRLSWSNIKSNLKTYFDSIYTTTSAVANQISTALVGYATESFVTSQGYITNVITALGFTPENVANKSTSTSLGTSDTLYPTQNAVKTYADTKVDKVTTSGVERAYIINTDGSQSTKAISEFGGTETFEQSTWMFSDFFGDSLNQLPFFGAVLNGGSKDATVYSNNTGNYIGSHLLYSGVSANGGYRYIDTTNPAFGGFPTKAGLTFYGIFKLISQSDARDRVIRIGFHNATTGTTTPTIGAFLEILGSTATFKTKGSGLETASSPVSLLSGATSSGVFYKILIEFISTTSVNCKVVDDSNNVILEVNHTTNIPSVGQRFGCGLVATITTAGTNNQIMSVDYMAVGRQKPNFLNDF